MLEQTTADETAAAAKSSFSTSNTASKARRAAKTLSGFYVTRNAYQGKHFVALILDKNNRQNVVIVRPTTGRNEMNTTVNPKNNLCVFARY